MSVKVEYLEGSVAKIMIEIPSEDIKAAEEEAYRDMKASGRLNLNGFRRKNLTMDLLKRMYGKNVFVERAVANLANKEFIDYVQKENPTMLGEPKMDELSKDLDLDQPVTVVIRVPVYVEPVLGEYKGVKAPMQDATVTEAEISEYIAREQDRNGRMVTVEDRPAEMGDTVTLDYVGTIDGEAFDGGTGKDQALVLGSHNFSPGFEEGLVGVNAGEERDVVVTFPEDYHESVAGKEATFHCTIKNVQRKELPELDDEFAQDVSECTTFEAYIEKVRDLLSTQKASQVRMAFENAAVAQAVANATFMVPAVSVEDRARRDYEYAERQYKAMGVTMEQFAEANGMDLPTYKMLMRMQAEDELRANEILTKIAMEENLTISDEEIDDRLKLEAAQRGITVEDLVARYPNAHESVSQALLREKGRRFVIDHAVVGEPEQPAAQEPQAQE